MKTSIQSFKRYALILLIGGASIGSISGVKYQKDASQKISISKTDNSNELRLNLDAEAGARYQILSSDNLTNPISQWETEETLIGTGARVEVKVVEDGNKFFTALKGKKPISASEYASMIESELGLVPAVDVGDMVEIPLYKDGKQVYGSFDVTQIDNPTRTGDLTNSGSSLQRYEGRKADGSPMPEVVWVALFRLDYQPYSLHWGGVALIGYNKNTGATAFFERGDIQYGPDYISQWVSVDGNNTFSGVMPDPSNPQEFNKAYIVPPDQCVSCHQADPFITNDWINAAVIPETGKPVVPQIRQGTPYYVIGFEDWDMRTIHIEDNSCLDCHRVGLSTVRFFEQNGYDVNAHMPPRNPGSLASDFEQLKKAWLDGVDNTPRADWIIPPKRKHGDNTVVGIDYPHKADFNNPEGSSQGSDD